MLSLQYKNLRIQIMAVIQNLKQSINGKVEAIMLKDVRKKVSK